MFKGLAFAMLPMYLLHVVLSYMFLSKVDEGASSLHTILANSFPVVGLIVLIVLHIQLYKLERKNKRIE